MKKYFLVLAMFFCALATSAAFRDIRFQVQMSCDDDEVQGTLRFVSGAPNGDYSVSLDSDSDLAADITIDGTSLADGPFTKTFKIPRDEDGGLKFDVGTTTNFWTVLGNSFDPFDINITATPGDDLTSSTGFGSASGTLTVTDTGCNGDDTSSSAPKKLDDALVGADDPSFEDVDTSVLISTDTDLVVNFTYKVDTTLYNLFVGDLKEGEDITTKAKELAKKFGIKLDIKNLKKLARKELKDAGKGLKGEEKEAAINAAKEKGINKLLAEIQAKLAPLPDKSDPEAREKAKTIRKAKKAKILQGLVVELVTTTDGTMDGKAVKCLTFKITLPVKLCPKEDGSKTVVIAGYNIMNLEVGESVTIDVPVQVVGVFKQFFGDSGKNGKNGKTTIPITLTNPAE